MKRTQLYLNESIWESLHVRARQCSTSISELVRQAVDRFLQAAKVREKYGRSPASRQQAMMAVVGIWKDREDLPDSTTCVRQLRKGKRLRRIAS